MAPIATFRQLEALAIVATSIIKKGYPPTHREVMRAMGIRSVNGVADHYRCLERKGLLKTGDPKQWAASRAVWPTDYGWLAVGMQSPVKPNRKPSTARIVRVMFGWRCAVDSCNAITFDANKPCPMCQARAKGAA